MIRRCVCTLVLASLPGVLHAQCSPGAERGPLIVPDFLYLVSTSSMSSVDPNAVSTAAAAWGSCVSENRPSFPYPTLTPTWNAPTAQLNVVFHTGFNPLNNSTCGATSGNTINVYSNAYKQGTNILLSCGINGYAQIIEHELGHYYGLADILNQPSCADIMAQFDGSQHYVGLNDCTSANMLNQAFDEYAPIDYTCNQPCYTDCYAGSCPALNQGSPIIFDLDGGGFRLSGPDDPVYFDLYTDGTPVWTAWTAGGSGTAFLALDLNGNGRIDDAGELFGNHTRLQDGSFADNGYDALAQYDEPVNGGNGNGVIDAGDTVFSRLRIWTDWNHNGKTDPGELQTLPEAAIVAIDLAYRYDHKTDRYDNEFRYRGRALRSNDRGGTREITIYDVFFVPAQPPVIEPQRGADERAASSLAYCPASVTASRERRPRGPRQAGLLSRP